MPQVVTVTPDNHVVVTPTGPTGPRGPAGPRGPQGIPGDTASAEPDDYVTPQMHGAPANGSSSDYAAMLLAVEQATEENKILRMYGTYTWDEPVPWTDAMGPLFVDARNAETNYTGDDYAWRLTMPLKSADLPNAVFVGGKLTWGNDAVGGIYAADVRNSYFRDMRFHNASNLGIGLHIQNHGGWSERDQVDNCRFTGHTTAVKCSIYRTTPTTKSIVSGVAEVVIPGHEFIVGDRLNNVFSPADPDFDGDRQITAIVGDSIFFATSGADLAPTATGGQVSSRGSFARLQLFNLFFSGGAYDEAHIDFEQGVGPYGGQTRGLRGNIIDGSSLIKMRAAGAWNGHKIGDIDVELQAGGECYIFDVPDTWTGGRPEYVGNTRTTGVVKFYKTEPTGLAPWEPGEFVGGIRPDPGGLIDARDGGLILPESDDDPLDADLPYDQAVNGRVKIKTDSRRIHFRVGPDNYYFVQGDKSEQVPKGQRFVRVEADVNRTSTTTLSEQTQLTISDILAYTYWGFQGRLLVSGLSSIKLALDVPGGTPNAWVRWGDNLDTLVTEQLTNTSVTREIPVGATPTFVEIFGTFRFGQFPGSLTFLWAQEVSDSTPTVIHDGSWIHAIQQNA